MATQTIGFPDRTYETTSVIGTGNAVLLGAVSVAGQPASPFSASLVNGQLVDYVIVDSQLNVEEGCGIYLAAPTNAIQRTAGIPVSGGVGVYGGSAGAGVLVNFPNNGPKNIFASLPSGRISTFVSSQSPIASQPPVTLGNLAPYIDLAKPPVALVPENGVGNNDNWAILQGLADAAVASGTAGYAYWKFPPCVGGTSLASGQFSFTKPVLWDVGNLTVEGAGQGVTGLIGQYGGVILSTARRQFTPGHFVNAFGILDSSIANNTRFGLRVYDPTGDHLYMCPSFSGTPFDQGPYISNVMTRWGIPQFVIDFAVQPNVALANFASTGGAPVAEFGMFKFNSLNQQPWYLTWSNSNSANPPTFSLGYATSDGTYNRTATFPGIQGAAFLRVSIQIDLTNGVIAAWVGTSSSTMQQVTVTGTVPSGVTLANNIIGAPFNIGTITENNGNKCVVDYYGSSNFDQTFFGLNISTGLLYNVGTTGSAQTRIDGLTITDLLTYFTKAGNNSRCIGLLPLDDDGVSNLASQGLSTTRNQPYRLVKMFNSMSEQNIGYGLLSAGDLAQTGASISCTIRDIAISTGQRYGAAVTQGAALDMRYERCLFGGGSFNFLTYNLFVSYWTILVGCIFQGSRISAIKNGRGNILVRDARFASWSWNIYLACGAGLYMDGENFAGPGLQNGVPFDIYGNNGGLGITVKGIQIDYEGPYPLCYLRCDTDIDGNVYVENFVPGANGGSTNPHIVLTNTPGSSSPGKNYTCTVVGSQDAFGNPIIVGGVPLNPTTPPASPWVVATAPVVTPGTTVGCCQVL